MSWFIIAVENLYLLKLLLYGIKNLERKIFMASILYHILIKQYVD